MPKCNVKLNVKNSNDDDEVLEKDEKEEKDKEKEKVTIEEEMMTRAKKKLMEGNKNSVNLKNEKVMVHYNILFSY